MTHILWILPVMFVFLASSLIWLLVGCRGIWWLKLLMMALTVVLSVVAWRSIDNVLGYPKPATMASLSGQSAILYFKVIDEPRAIYLWVKMDNDSELRVFKFPYTRPLHKQAEAAQQGGDDPAHIMFGEDQGKKGNSGGSQTQSQGEIYVLPPPITPPKTQ